MTFEASPLMINIMLACHVSHDAAANLGDRVWNSEASQVARAWLLSQGLIDPHNRSTERGRVWVEHICSTPPPVQVWVRPPEAAE